MKITLFAKEVCKEEGLKKQVNVAQVAEVLRVVNRLLGGQLYKIIRAEGSCTKKN